ncbi:MAG: N-succinyldiaminopimelate aminotransferase [Glaciecola sp.]
MDDQIPVTNRHLAKRLQPYTSSIFTEMSTLAATHGAVNLGQGAPDFSGPTEVTETAVQAIRDGRNQYAPGNGIAPLRKAIADHQRDRYALDFDPHAEITVTAGATEAITAALQALCEQGDEVIAFAPFYDSYPASCAMAGAKLVPVALAGPDLRVDGEKLRAAVTPRTRLLIINSPHNPTGRVLDETERRAIVEVAVEHDLLVITDEVYEHLTFDDAVHVPLISMAGMRERTIQVSSAGKTFAVTGWKVGWVCASPELSEAVRSAKTWMTFSNGTPLQFGVAEGLRLGPDWFEGYREDYAHRRDVLCGGLEDAGFEVRRPQGTYFALFDGRQLGVDEDGLALCRRLPRDAGVAAIPTAVFYGDLDHEPWWLRLAFCKDVEAISEGIDRLAAFRDRTTS